MPGLGPSELGGTLAVSFLLSEVKGAGAMAPAAGALGAAGAIEAEGSTALREAEAEPKEARREAQRLQEAWVRAAGPKEAPEAWEAKEPREAPSELGPREREASRPKEGPPERLEHRAASARVWVAN